MENPIKKEVFIGNCRMILGDCLEVMQDIDLSVVGACVTDPPYGLGIDGQKKQVCKNKKHNRKFHEKKHWDNKSADVRFVLDLNIPTIIFGGNYFNLPPTKCFLIWDKGQYNLTMADGEVAWTNLNIPLRIFKKNRAFLISENSFHPTQKPIQLMKWCIEQLPKDCTGAILDPFMGSGTTGVACAKMGRSFIGIELDEDYFNIACKRIEDAYKQGDLFI